MHFIYPNLVFEMNKRGVDYKDIAGILGISEHAAYRRMRGLAGWKLCETICLCRYFGINDTAWLFKCDVAVSNCDYQ